MWYLNNLGLLCNLGNHPRQLLQLLLTRDRPVPTQSSLFHRRGGRWLGKIRAELPALPAPLARFDCRNNRLANAALTQIRPAIEAAKVRYGAGRVAVVMATSTTGIAATEEALRVLATEGDYPRGYHALQGALAGLGEFVAATLEIHGPTSTISTACSSSGNALLSARRLLSLGLCDAVVVGGVDSICDMTLQGFGALEALARDYCRPFTTDRDGINIGEGAAVFLMSAEAVGPRFLGGAASSDAYHISAPQPEGEGAFAVMQAALRDARIQAADVDYLNLHGTGTPHNDSMECAAVARLFGSMTPCSSTKGYTGHTLGAASALELALCWLLLSGHPLWRLPPSPFIGEIDPELAPVCFTGANDCNGRRPEVCMSNSFAFGGSNVSLVLGANND